MENKFYGNTYDGTPKEQFLAIYKSLIKRDGADKLLAYLESSDFFQAPASTRFHGSYDGGLCEHSLSVYYILKEMAKSLPFSETLKGVTDESLAVVSLLHDMCKIGIYKPSFRNVKDDNGVWQKVQTYEVDDELPYGHGEKSVYVLSGFIKLSREEAFAIRYHMGFANANGNEETRNVGTAFEMFPLAYAVSVADEFSTCYAENK